MFQPFPYFVGLRYAMAPRGNRFVSVVSSVALLGLTLGVAALIVVLSVMNGFERELRDRILAVIPHAILEADATARLDWPVLREALRARPGVRGVAPFVGGSVMLSAGAQVQGAVLTGVLPKLEGPASGLDRHMIEGELVLLKAREYGIVLGSLLARQLGVTMGDRVTVVLPRVSVTAAGLLPRLRRFRVVGLFSVGAQVDADTALIHLDDAERLFQSPEAQGLRLWFDDADLAPASVIALGAEIGEEIITRDWTNTQGSLFAAIRNEKRMIGLLLLVMVAVAAFNIVSIMTMTVAEKRSAVAVLRTLGASPTDVMLIFVTRGCAIGLTGISLGVLLGVPLAQHIGEVIAMLERVLGFRVFNPGVYFISHMPSLLRWPDVWHIVLAALLLTVSATLFPAWRAMSISPAEILSHD